MGTDCHCRSCGQDRIDLIYRVEQVPVNSVMLMSSREEALNYPRGDVSLGFCHDCGFIANVDFNTGTAVYQPGYEATQTFSPTFNAFHNRLASQLVARHNLRGKQIVEIGCGNGEFLEILCELGDNRGTGFDPAYVPCPAGSNGTGKVEIINDYYSDKYAGMPADFICCKMTLEHIADVAGLVGTVRRAVDHNPEAVVFFQVPNAVPLLRGGCFWDVYYEHCSYFSPGSLGRLFRRCGFEVLALNREYDEQYLTIECRAAGEAGESAAEPGETVQSLLALARRFQQTSASKKDFWKRELAAAGSLGQRTVLWGGGSKAGAFLTTLGIDDEIEYVVDINPRRCGTFIPGSGQQIMSPAFLEGYQPDLILVMNPVYLNEVTADCRRMNVRTRILAV